MRAGCPVMWWLESIWLWDDGSFSLYKSPDESVPVTTGSVHHYRKIQQITGLGGLVGSQLLVSVTRTVPPQLSSPGDVWIVQILNLNILVIPVSVCGVVRLVTIIIIRDNRLLSLQVIKPSRCESQEKNINLSSVGKQERGERERARGPILGLTSFCWGRLSLPR